MQPEGPEGERVGDTYRTTMADVAKAAGVSRTTVSFVLNNRDGARIPPQTRERVRQCRRTGGRYVCEAGDCAVFEWAGRPGRRHVRGPVNNR